MRIISSATCYYLTLQSEKTLYSRDPLTDNNQKRLNGELYDPLSKDLRAQRKRAKALCFEYNQCHPDQKGKRQQILSNLLGSVNRAVIEANFNCDYGYNINIGKNFYANHHCTILDAATVSIADNVMFGPCVNLTTATHPLDAQTRLRGLELAQPIVIHNNVWLGMGVHVLPGVTIGENVVVAAGAVVTRDIASNSLAAGVPAKIIRELS